MKDIVLMFAIAATLGVPAWLTAYDPLQEAYLQGAYNEGHRGGMKYQAEKHAKFLVEECLIK